MQIAEVEAVLDDGNRYELIAGELHVSAAPSFFHQTILLNVGSALKHYLRDHPVGKIAPSVGVIFDDLNVNVRATAGLAEAGRWRTLWV
jgi:hypothetical protein